LPGSGGPFFFLFSIGEFLVMAPSSEEKPILAPEPPTFTVGEIARMVGGRIEGEPEVRVKGIAPLEQAGEDELAFLAQRGYLRFLSQSGAKAVLVSESLAPDAEGFLSRVVVKKPHLALPALLTAFFPPKAEAVEIHPTAVFGKGAELGEDVSVGPYAVVGGGAKIGDGTRIGAHVVVGEGCVIGESSVLFPQVVLYPGTRLGARVIIHSGARLGTDGFGYVPLDGEHRKVPQVGACVVEDDVEIGANCCIDRGSIGRTVIGKGSKLDNLVQLGHNVQVGEGVLIVSQVGVSGSARIGSHAMIGGQAGVAGHTEIGAGAKVGGQAGVIGDIAPGEVVSGYPARNHREYLKAMGRIFKLPKTLSRMKALEDRLSALEEAAEG
jgi:UDP-3-O-[3-hydroxymyristoyl] glucosamine N-acyltransferase